MKLSVIGDEALQVMVELAENAPIGNIAEVGVYKGGSAELLARIARRNGRNIFLFDTFYGMPFSDEIDIHTVDHFNDTSLQAVKDLIPDAKFKVGTFPATLSDDVQDLSFVHVDCDQYRSVRDCIVHLLPRIMSGGIMLFDDYEDVPGAGVAVREQIKIEDLHRTPQRKMYYVKP
jgi:O-methyltransferase